MYVNNMCISSGNSLKRWYTKHREWCIGFPGDIPDDVIESVVVHMDGLLQNKKANCCMHYAYILMKCLEDIGEANHATRINDIYRNFFDRKKKYYEETWNRAFGV